MRNFAYPAIPGACAALLISLAACTGPDAPTAPAPGTASPTRQAELLYSESFSDSGIFSIESDPAGAVRFSIQARIGSEAERLMLASGTAANLAEIYRSLHGGSAAVPAAVAKASEALARQAIAAPAPQASAPERERSIPLAKSASESAFKTNYCRDIYEGSYVWDWQTCDWYANVHDDEGYLVDSKNGFIDRVYAWNNTPWTATLSLWNTNQTATISTWRPTLQPYWVTWFQWGGTYSFAVARMELPTGKAGELGMSTHTPVPYVR